MATLLARYDLEKFKWEPLQGVSKGCVRRLGGGEQIQDIQSRHFNGLHTLFFGLMVDLHSSVNITKFTSSAQECWCSLRFQFPTIASSIDGSDQLPTLIYTTGTLQEIRQWARRTFLVHLPSQSIDLEQLRVNEGQRKVPSSDGDFTRIHLVPGGLANDGTVSKFGLLFHSHHSIFDGSAVKIIMNFYLDQLAKAVSDSRSTPKSTIQWGNELENLPPAVFSILNSNEALPIPPDSAQEPSFDDEYYKCMTSVIADLGAVKLDAYGFRALQKDKEWPKTRRAEVLFTKEESERILVAAKTSGYTLTHIAHAALDMVIIAYNPPNSESSSHYLNKSALINCRGRLNSNWSLYPGYALCYASIRIPISTVLSPDGSVLPMDRDMLLKVAEVAKRQYRAHIDSPSSLSQSAQIAELCASVIARDNIKLPPDRCYPFASDGKGERYLNPTFTAATGETVLSLTKFFLSVNCADAEPAFRVSSWAGVIDISADFDTNMKTEDMMNYLNQWKRFMLLILD